MTEDVQRALTNAEAARIVGEKYREGHECDLIALADEVIRLRAAIADHRAQKADDRCIEDDDKLYEALGDGIKCDRRVGDKYEMLGNCARFIDRRCESGGWPTYIEIEKELNDAHYALDELEVLARHYIGTLGKLFVPASRTAAERIRLLVVERNSGTDANSDMEFSKDRFRE